MPFPQNDGYYPDPSIPMWMYVGAGALSGNFTTREGVWVEYWDMQPEFLNRFISTFLGTARKSGLGINRILPVRHPYFNGFYASRIASVQGLGPQNYSQSDPAPYKLLRVGLEFAPPPYRVQGDRAFIQLVGQKNMVEFLYRNQGAFRWEAGTPAEGSLAVTGVTKQSLLKQRLTFRWNMVPDDGLYTAGGFWQGGRAKNLDDALNTVNILPWFEYPAGTLLFEDWEPIPHGSPESDQIYWDVILTMLFFDPPQGGTVRGHNTLPHPTNGKWYGVFASSDAARSIFEESDFDRIFYMN